MARKMNMGLMLGAAAGGLGLLFLLGGKKKISAPKDSGKDVNAMTYEELVTHTLQALDSETRETWDRSLLEQAMNSGLDLTTAGADEIKAAMDHEEALLSVNILRDSMDAAYMGTQPETALNPSMPKPPQSVVDDAIAVAKAVDPNVKVLPAESLVALHNGGQLPTGTVLVFISGITDRATQRLRRGIVLWSSAEAMRRMTIAAGAATAGTAGYGDYVQMPYSGMGFGALYSVKGGSGATGLGY